LKFVALFLAISGIVPIALLLRSNPRFVRAFWTVFGMLPFLSNAMPAFDIGLVTWAGEWVGFVYGLELTQIDILAVAALISLSGRSVPAWCKLPLLAYVLAVVLSILQADEPMAATFGAWQAARMFFIMIVVTRACLEPQKAIFILQGMALGMALHFLAVLHQRFALNLPQAHGLFIHQNTLGMSAHMVLYPAIALLLHGYPATRSLVATVVATIVVVVFTASRATVGFAAIGIGMTYLVLALAGLTWRKVGFAVMGTLALAVIAPLALASFEKRFSDTPLNEEQYDERAAFNRAAAFILADHPAGIGSNHYVHVARNQGYSERAGVVRTEANRNNIVHSAYRLAAAETGYLGLVTFCLALLVPLLCAFLTGWRERASAEGTLLLGLGIALFIVCLHSFYEWIFFIKEVQYLVSYTMGMIFGLSLHMNARRRGSAAAERGGNHESTNPHRKRLHDHRGGQILGRY
jgi:hypothetical protein